MSNKIALITGGSRGLGRSAALALAASGTDLIITYQRQQQDAETLAATLRRQGRKVIALQLDCADTASFARFAAEVRAQLRQHWQRDQFDFLLNNAGVGVHESFASTTEAQFDTLMNVHLKGVFFLTQTLLPLVSNGGRIVNVSSGLTRFSVPGYAAYAAMKGAIEVLSRYWAKELGARHIAVNTVAPGAIATDFGGGAVRDNEQLNAYLASQTALGRVGEPEDIGGVIAALFSEGTAWINAQRIEASGGMFL